MKVGGLSGRECGLLYILSRTMDNRIRDDSFEVIGNVLRHHLCGLIFLTAGLRSIDI